MNQLHPGQDGNCGTCRYYVEHEHGVGACHRHPPGYTGEQTLREAHRWRFPVVPPSAWCGEHKPQPPLERPSSSAESR
jgi:hypothetical protein